MFMLTSYTIVLTFLHLYYHMHARLECHGFYDPACDVFLMTRVIRQRVAFKSMLICLCTVGCKCLRVVSSSKQRRQLRVFIAGAVVTYLHGVALLRVCEWCV